MTENELKDAIDIVKSYGYRLIEKYEKPRYYNDADGSNKFIGTYLDVETTGLDYTKDKVIELGLIVFEYSEDGKIFNILDEYSQFQDPGFPIPHKSIEISGVTDDMVKGKEIDRDIVIQHISNSDLIIAHNASFDRSFLETTINNIPLKPWACTMTQIAWNAEGVESSKLEYLAYKFGFYFEGHRAVNDCLAGVHILSKDLPRSNKSVMAELLNACKKNTFKLWAQDAPFECKDILKNRGYRWCPDNGQDKYKAWWIELDDNCIAQEIVFLWSEIYARRIKLPVNVLFAQSRFSILNSFASVEHESLSKKIVSDIYVRADSLMASI